MTDKDTYSKARKKTQKRKKTKKNGKKFLRFIPLATIVVIGLVLSIFILRDDRVGDCGNHAKQGIDVSHHQGRIDWERLAAKSDIKYAYIKASEGATHKDTRYHDNVKEARKAGIAVGSYHYFHPDVPVEKQLMNFTGMVDMLQQDLLPVIDIEEPSKNGNKAIADSLLKFARLVTSHCGVEPIIYTGQSYYNERLQNKVSSYRLWIARYGIFKFKKMPQLQDGNVCNIWQYSNRGRVEGIAGDVDLNTLCDDVEIEDIMIKK